MQNNVKLLNKFSNFFRENIDTFKNKNIGVT